jgi:integrase
MARRSTGGVVERRTQSGTVFAARFRAYGKRRYVTLGVREQGMSRRDAERELGYILADVERGTWKPDEPVAAPDEPVPQPTFHEFASAWFERRKASGIRERTVEHLRWVLCEHLLPEFGSMVLPDVTVQAVDDYVARKAAHGGLSNGSINRTVTVLASVMERAVEYGHVTRNPASGRDRKLPVRRSSGHYLEPAQVAALLTAAGQLDAEDRRDRPIRQPLLATLAFAGLRIGELLALRWQDVDLAQGTLRVRASKTDAGVRVVDVQPELREALTTWKMRTAFAEPTDLVFGTATGAADNRNNVRRRVVARAAERANAVIAESGECDPLPVKDEHGGHGLSPHALRRTYASWLIAAGEDVAYVMDQLGHTDPGMTLGLYAKVLRSKGRRASRPDAQDRPLTGIAPALVASDDACAVTA